VWLEKYFSRSVLGEKCNNETNNRKIKKWNKRDSIEDSTNLNAAKERAIQSKLS
jgi:hypothetical protein